MQRYLILFYKTAFMVKAGRQVVVAGSYSL